MIHGEIKKGDLKFGILVFSILVLFSLFLIYFKPEMTGLVIYEEDSYEWDFSSENDYSFSTNEITLENNKAELKASTTLENNTIIEQRTSLLIEAKYKDEDEIEELNAIDNEKVSVKDYEKLNIKFDNNIYNNDKINLYIVDTNFDRTIHICNYDETCDFPGYGSLNYNSDMGDGLYSITLSSLSSSIDSFRIKTSDKVKIDYIDATYLFLEFNETEITTYPETASIETDDLSLGVVGNSTVLFDYTGNIDFEYSVNSGDDWMSIEDNDNINLENENKIRFRATLNYDESLLPELNKITLNYNVCNENWQCNSWGECSEQGIENRTCLDINECGTIINKPEEERTCTYFTDYYEIEKSRLIAIQKDTLTRLNGTKIVLDLMIKQNLNSTNITLREYNDTSKDITELKPLGRFLDITVNNEINQNINYSIIKLYYTEDDLENNNLDEDTLKLYYYNETNDTWGELNSSINKEENYVYSTIYHFSTYGIFGDEREQESQPVTSSGGGGSSGGSSRRRSSSRSVVVKEPVKEQSKEEEPFEEVEEEAPEELIDAEEENFIDFLTSKATYQNLKNLYKENIMFFIALLSLLILYFVFRIIHIRRD